MAAPRMPDFRNLRRDRKDRPAPTSRSNRKDKLKKGKQKAADAKEEEQQPEDTELLADNENSKSYMPDIYRCPDCGYEQDEPGTCPDHSSLELIKVISDGKDPLAPQELDGNEDILVDVPLNIQFKKDEIEKKEDDKADKDNEKDKKSKSAKSNKKK